MRSVSLIARAAWRGGILLGAAVAAAATSAPVVTGESGYLLELGGPASTAILNGSGFQPGAVARWNGQDLSTTFVSSTQLFAVIPASDLTAVGPVTLTVVNPDGGTSNNYPQFVEPDLNSMTPNAAVAGSGGFTLTLTGAGFPAGWVVKWNDTSLVTTYVSSSELTAVVPAALVSTAGQDSVIVGTPDQEQASRSLLFSVTSGPPAAPAPVVTSLSPQSVAPGGPGFALIVNGSGFVGASTVEWNGQGLATTFVSATQLTAQVPASDVLNSGSASVTVVNPGITPSAALTFTITQPAPVLNSLSPSSAAAGAPAFTLTVNGSGFVAGSLVQWNGATLSTTFQSSAQLTAAVDAFRIATAGTAAVAVWSPSGALSNNLPFTITAAGAPVLSSLLPSSVPAGGSAFTLTVNGSGFVAGAVVKWNSQTLPTTFVSNSQLTAQVTASQIQYAGIQGITVSDSGGISNALQFTVAGTQPVIISVTPPNATAGGAGFVLTITGLGMVSGSVIQWNGQSLATTYVSGTQLTAQVPASDIAAAGMAILTIVNPGGVVSNTAQFPIASAGPVVTSISPTSTMAGAAPPTLTVNGSGFVSGSLVQWNGATLNTTFQSSTQLTATVDAFRIATAGTAAVAVWNPGGALSNALTFTITAAGPVVNSMSPTSAAAGGAAFTLTVNGSGFVAGAAVQWNGGALSTTFVSSTQLTAQVPAPDVATAGNASVTVVNSSGAVSNALAFKIAAALPVVSSISPATATAGGTAFTLTVNGSGFVSGSLVEWSGAVLNTTFVSSTQVAATVPDADIAVAAAISVTVVNPPGVVSNGVTFTITGTQPAPPPALTSIYPSTATAGASGFVLTVTGGEFISGSTVQWNGQNLATTFVSASQLTAQVPAADIATPGNAAVTVVNPGGAPSKALPFTITASGQPSISAVQPNTVNAGGADFSLVVSGTGFASGATVNWAGTPLSTSTSGAGQLTAAVPASFIALSGRFSLTVSNPTGPASTVFSEYVQPVLVSIGATPVASGTVTVTATGAGFVPTDVILMNAGGGWTNLPTTFVSSTALTAPLATSALANGALAFTVGDPAAGTSSQAVAYATPAISSLAPPSVVAQGPAFTLTVTGSGFDSTCTVIWNQAPLSTTFASATQVTAAVPAALIATAGTATITVTSSSGALSKPVSYTIGPNLPVTSTAGIVNAASGLPVIAPGSLVSIYGVNLAADTTQAAAAPLPYVLGGTQVLVNGTQVPILFVSPGQINFQLPYETLIGTATLVVESPVGAGAPVSVTVSPTGPGVITALLTGQALAVNLADGTLNSAQSPAAPGTYVMVYVIGQGQVDPPIPDGAAAPLTPLSSPVAPVLVNVGGQPATVQFAGMAPDFVGLMQLNVQIPSVQAGEQSLQVMIGGVAANATTIAVGGGQ